MSWSSSPLLLALLVCVAAASAQEPSVLLADFTGKAKHTWRVMNDPVMGGVSASNFNISESAGIMSWAGEVRIVPKLSAPGFCNLETTVGRFANAQGTTHLMMKVRTNSPQFRGFKVSFAAHTLNPQFKSYKSNFNVTGEANTWQVISIPWNHFSNNWSPFTGDCDTKDPTGKQHYCCTSEHPEVCPKDRYLSQIEQLGLWTEGHSGNFTLDVMWIGAGSPNTTTLAMAEKKMRVEQMQVKQMELSAAASDHKLHCHVQKDLRFNVSGRRVTDYLPFGSLPFEGLAEAICCDSFFSIYAEPSGFFQRDDVPLLSALNGTTGPVTFYDSACGLPLFRAPVNRTMDDFVAESKAHGWPSFRTEEVVHENVVVGSDGTVTSKCGTHLGDNLPDDKGDRFCIDLVCISGNPKA